MDIRNYFAPAGGAKKKTGGSSQSNKDTKKKIFVLDSDEEDESPKKVSKRQRIEDSDDDIFEVTTKRKAEEKKKKEEKKSYKRKSLPKPSPPKLKPVAVSDFFGSSPVARKEKEKPPIKKKKEEVEIVLDSDDDFAETLAQLDEEDTKTKHTKPESKPSAENDAKPKPNENSPPNKMKEGKKEKKEKEREKAEKKKEIAEDTKPKPNENSPPNKMKREEKEVKKEKKEKEREKEKEEKKKEEKAERKKEKEKKKDKLEETKPKPNENSPPNKIKEEKQVKKEKKDKAERETPEKPSKEPQSLSSKLSSKLKCFEYKRKSDDMKTNDEDKEDEELMHKDKKIKQEEGEEKKDTPKKSKSEDRSDEDTKDKKKNKTDDVKLKRIPKLKEYEGKKVTLKKEREIKDEKITPKKEKGTPGKATPGKDIKKEGENETPVKGENSEAEMTPQEEKKKHAKEAYLKFLRRSGPANPGSKPIPEGKPGCLQGLVFVLSGVYESLDREEAGELVKQYGGKVTTSISRNTSYLVLGSEPGQSKVTKAEQLGTKLLDEDGLLDLIRTLPGKGVKEETKKDKDTNKAANKLKAFAKEEKKEENKGLKNSSPDLFATPSPKRSLLSQTSSPSSQGSIGSPSSTWSGSSSPAPSTQPLSSQEVAERPGDVLMWVDKYKPANIKNIIGQQGDRSNVRKLQTWLKNWVSNQLGDKKLQRPSPWAKDDNGAFFKAALLSGPPGVGKTTSAHLVCKELGYDIVELNASDARSKRSLDEIVSELLTNKSLAGFATNTSKDRTTSAHHVLLMDEVDGMSGNEDRGGVQELIALIKKSRVPIITMCNDRNHPKIRSLANHCFDLRFHKPRIEQIRGPMMSICFREGIKLKPDALDQIIIGANQDVRQILHHLSMWSATEKNLQADDMKREAQRAKKDFKKGPWDVCRSVFTHSEHKDMTIHQKSDLFFHDYSIAPLFVQENYPKVTPRASGGKRIQTLELLAKTAESLADGDLTEKLIRSGMSWSLLPTQAVFSSVLPGSYMSGHLAAQIEFPRWLGNNSKRNKFDRIMQELQMHMRLKISGNKLDVGLDYSGSLRDMVTLPLIKRGAEGVSDSVEAMNEYDLLREDLDSLLELSSWPGKKDPMSGVESKVKAAFTRTYNKDSHMTPFAVQTITKKKKVKMGEDAYGDEEEEEEEENDDITSSGMIKQKKGAAKKEFDLSQGKGKGKGNSKGGKGKGGGGGGKGRGKK